mmetsp:Transcript_78047/g.208636  ORF Transcript_78047/g.208636 Transcript_78047/m.208636 type:complete len:203 (-) Transcript_78047:108-716(-)
MPAIQVASRLLTVRGTLGRSAGQDLGAVAGILRAKHGTSWLSALCLAAVERIRLKLRAPGLADRHLAIGLAFLLTRRGRAAPSAMWNTALPVLQRHDGRSRLVLGAVGRVPSSCRVVGVVVDPNHVGELCGSGSGHQHCPVRRRPHAAALGGIEINDLPRRQRHRNPYRPSLSTNFCGMPSEMHRSRSSHPHHNSEKKTSLS